MKDSVAPIGLLALLGIALAASAMRGEALPAVAGSPADGHQVVNLAHDAEVPEALSFRPVASDTVVRSGPPAPAANVKHALMRIRTDESLSPAARELLERAADVLSDAYRPETDRVTR